MMKTEIFLKALGEVDDKYITEAISYQKKYSSALFIKWGSLAACLVAAICLASNNSTAPVTPVAPPTSDSSYSDYAEVVLPSIEPENPPTAGDSSGTQQPENPPTAGDSAGTNEEAVPPFTAPENAVAIDVFSARALPNGHPDLLEFPTRLEVGTKEQLAQWIEFINYAHIQSLDIGETSNSKSETIDLAREVSTQLIEVLRKVNLVIPTQQEVVALSGDILTVAFYDNDILLCQIAYDRNVFAVVFPNQDVAYTFVAHGIDDNQLYNFPLNSYIYYPDENTVYITPNTSLPTDEAPKTDGEYNGENPNADEFNPPTG